jgi:hypothetical protein
MADSCKLTVKCLFCSFERTGETAAMLAAGRKHAATHTDPKGGAR